MTTYADFLERKLHLGGEWGFEPSALPDFLFGFQRDLVTWSTMKGRAALFADCGLGKTPMQLAWSYLVAAHTGKPVLILTPLAVSYQTIREAEKFGIDAARSQDGKIEAPIVVTNYERLEHFRADQFSGVVCDESSILKNFDGVRRQDITDFMRKLPYRLLCTATAAPNDYVELGTSSEALGEMGHMDMLGRFFVNDSNNSVKQQRFRWSQAGSFGRENWRFKGHAEEAFWRWVCSWARATRRPSDLGYDDNGFVLPDLVEHEHVVEAREARPDRLFDLPAQGLHEEREEARRTIEERCLRVAELVDHGEQALVWCQLNDEGDLLAKLIPDAEQVKGADTDDAKERRLMDFAEGNLRVLVTKPKIGAWGLNLQKCAHVTFFPSHSYEQYYQGVRRCWRFGQERQVRVDLVTTEGGLGALRNLQRKANQADRMFTRLVAHMNEAQEILSRTEFDQREEIPSWLSATSA